MSNFENPPKAKNKEANPSIIKVEAAGSGPRTREFNDKMQSIPSQVAEENIEHQGFSNWQRMYISTNMKKVREQIAHAEKKQNEAQVLKLEKQVRMMEQGEVPVDLVPEKYKKFLRANTNDQIKDTNTENKKDEASDDSQLERTKPFTLEMGRKIEELGDNDLTDRIRKQNPGMSETEVVSYMNKLRAGQVDIENLNAHGQISITPAKNLERQAPRNNTEKDSETNPQVEDASKNKDPEDKLGKEIVLSKKVEVLASLRNEMKKKQAEYDRQAQDYYANQTVRQAVFNFLGTKLFSGNKVPAELQYAHHALEEAKNARRVHASEMRAQVEVDERGTPRVVNNRMSGPKMAQLMKAYDRYTSDTQEFKDGNQDNKKESSFKNIKEAQQANKNWWNKMPAWQKVVLGGTAFTGMAFVTSGVSMVALPAVVIGGGGVSLLGKKWQQRRAGSHEKILDNTSNNDARSLDQLLRKQQKELDVIEAYTVRAKVGTGVLAGAATGYFGAEATSGVWNETVRTPLDNFFESIFSDMSAQSGSAVGGGLGYENYAPLLEPGVVSNAPTMPQYFSEPLGHYTIMPNDSVYNIVLEKVISVSPEMSHLSPLEQQNLAMNFIDKLRANEGAWSLALTGSENPDIIMSGEGVQLDSWKQLMMQDGVWSLDRVGDNMGEFTNMLEAADALDPDTNPAFEVPSNIDNTDYRQGEVFGEGLGDPADVESVAENINRTVSGVEELPESVLNDRQFFFNGKFDPELYEGYLYSQENPSTIPDSGVDIGDNIADYWDYVKNQVPETAPPVQIEGLTDGSTWAEIRAVTDSGTRIPAEQIMPRIEELNSQLTEVLGRLQAEYDSPMYFTGGITTSAGENLLTFNTKITGKGISINLSAATAQEVITQPKSSWNPFNWFK